MTATDWLGMLSTWLVAAATGVLVLAFVAYAAQWAMAARAISEPVVVPSHDSPVQPPATEDPGHIQSVAGVALSLTWLATALLLVGILARAAAAERVPWGNMYEFGCLGTLASLVAFVTLTRLWSIAWAGPIITGFGSVVLGASMLFVYVPPGPLVPALDSYWLVIHVFAAFVAGAAFLVGAAASALFLIKQRAERRGSPDSGFLSLVPASHEIDQIAFKVHAFAFPIWTFAALIAGPIWAQYAWAATGAGIRRKSGRSSPGWSTRGTFTPGPQQGGAVEKPRWLRWSASRRSCSTSSVSTSGSPACTHTRNSQGTRRVFIGAWLRVKHFSACGSVCSYLPLGPRRRP